MQQQWGPLQRKHGPTGVPSDHFGPWQNRFAAVDHQGRITALVADGPTEPPVEDAYADLRSQLPADELPPLGFEAPTEGEEAERRAQLIEDLAPAEALTELMAAREDDQQVPLEALATWQLEHLWIEFAEHEAKTITHSHEHSAMGDQGGDDRHAHSHTHSGDSSHNHTHAAAKADEPEPERKVTVTPIEPGQLAEKVAELRQRHPQRPADRMNVKAFGDHSTPGQELELAIKLEGDTLVSSLASDEFGMVAAGADIPEIVENPGGTWHAYLCVEGIRTDEFPSRLLLEGACQIPDLPVSMRFLVEDEGGHWGAITCGRIDSMERQQVEGFNVIYAEGVFGTDENSQVAQLHVEEQTQRFVSIDPRDVECEVVEIEITRSTGGMFDEPDVEEDVDWWVQYSSLVIGAATIVATPALQQAVVAMANQELQWADLATERSPGVAIVAAAGGSSSAPAAWFDNPGFHVGDPRLIRQEDGHYACPLTVTDDGRIFGHAAYWGAKHTGFVTKDVTPPRSPTYAYFETGSYRTAEGEDVPVGQITMGCGHASTSLDYMAAVAHYDGGYGAVQMADVRAGEDDFGIWIAGALRPLRSADNPGGPTPDQLAQFKALGLSGDWRKVAGRKHFVACLAVPVPGFPISREALVASSAAEIEARATKAGLDDQGEIHSLVAAGRVHRLPADDRLALLERQVATLLDERSEVRQRQQRQAALERLQGLAGDA